MRIHAQLPLPLVLAIRAHLGRHRTLSLVTILAIASSVTLATGLEMSSRSVAVELERTARELAGAAEIEVVGGTLGVSEELLETVASIPGVRAAAPFMQKSFRVDRNDVDPVPIHVLGVDLLADSDIRSYRGSATVSDPLRAVAGEGAVLVPRVLAEQLNLAEGDPLTVRLGRTPYQLAVRGILEPEGIAEAFGGQLAVMDVYTLQTLLGREGWLDRIDVVVAADTSVESVAADIESAIGGRATVRRSGARDGWLDSALLSVRLVVSSLTVIAILVAALVSYSSLSLSVDQRIPELALLRASGLEPGRMRRFLYLDAALFAVLGSVVGVVFGRLAAEGLLGALSWTGGFVQGIELERLEVRPSTLLVAFVVGGLVSFAGVLGPARRASRLPPLEVLLAGEPERDAFRSRHGRWVAASLMAVSLLAAIVLVDLPMLRVSAFAFAGLVGLVVMARAVPALVARSRGALDMVVPGIGRLAGASLTARPRQTTLAILCVAGVVSGVALSMSLTQSMSRTLDGWMESMFRGGVIVTAGQVVAVQPEETISPETIRIIQETRGVLGVFDHVGERIPYRGEEVLLAAGNMDVLGRFGRFPVVSGDARAVAEAVSEGGIAISDRFARRFGVGEGDSVTLDTPKGRKSFRVAGIIRDFAGPAGSLNLDIGVFRELWPVRGVRDVVFWTEGDPGPVIADIRRRVGETQSLFFVYGDELSRFASSILRRFLGILSIVSLMVASLGGIAVWNVMLSAVTSRTRELALLRATGATAGQVRALTLIDGLVLGTVPGIAGIALGVAAGYPVVSRVMTDALGWSVHFAVEPGEFGLLMVGVLGASLLASLYPAWLAARVPMREVSGVE